MRTVYLRKIPDDTHYQIHSAAGARGMSLSEFVAAVVELHRRMQLVVEPPDADPAEQVEKLRRVLDKLGLSTVTK